jgi:hypothetical protein
VEGFDRAINELVSAYRPPSRRLNEMIQYVVPKHENARQFRHKQCLKLFNQIEQGQASLSLKPVAKCKNSLCGCGFIYAQIWDAARFPIIHEVGSLEVQ